MLFLYVRAYQIYSAEIQSVYHLKKAKGAYNER